MTTPAVSKPLKPCPFCGADHGTLHVAEDDDSGALYVVCDGCDARGPYRDVRRGILNGYERAHEEAIAAWNTRAGEDQP